MDKFSEPNDNLADAMNSLRGWKQIAEAAEKRISALLAELEAKDREIDAANARVDAMCAKAMNLTERAESAEKRLATPVWLPEKYNMKMAGDKSTKSMFYGHNSAINDSAKAIRAAGFTVEGDE